MRKLLIQIFLVEFRVNPTRVSKTLKGFDLAERNGTWSAEIS